MDDHIFDDSIKRKIGNYEEPEFDPSALASLHHQIASAVLLPWHARYRTELIAGIGVTSLALILLWSQWYIGNRNARQIEETLLQIKTGNEQIMDLQNEIEYLKTRKPDTIRIVDAWRKTPSLYNRMINRMAWRDRSLPYFDINHVEKDESQASGIDFRKEFTGTTIITNKPAARLVPRSQKGESIRVTPENNDLPVRSKDRSLPAKTIRELEKHYRKGVGIKLGPAFEMSQGFYSHGEGAINAGGGLLADLVLSPSLSLETGLKYQKRYYEIAGAIELAESRLPGVDRDIGSLQKAEIDLWLVEVPFNLRYRYPITPKAHWLAGAGYSAMIFRKQLFEYDYKFDSRDNFSVSSIHEAGKTSFLAGTINIAAGFSRELKNRKILETSLYYQHGLNGMGVEKTGSRYFGLRGVYWFRVR